ncbi:alkaline phosphatase D family protein [Thalassolituus sp.]|jgi:alkaline phosphatase D|uniref:alkaline phosphatase D family protein n=1 Tax=Thalassolituus sp. TaxID=2030822 RepID=UPI002A82425C|nr:alkaline phosphatase D family protein [Thalassolituus sp.]
MPLSRREFLLDSAGSTLLAPLFRLPSSRRGFPFRHGVASGDALTDRVILWTRISSDHDTASVGFRYVVALDQDLKNRVVDAYGVTDSSRDFTVKIDVDGLQANTTYFYAFEALGQWSDTGRTRTLPEGSCKHLRIAFTSCSNFAQGYFNVYRDLAARTDLDAILHLGDYIYEYANLEESLTTGRIHEPPRETLTLADYRARHACYKSDRDLQQVHRQHGFYIIWDDHEVANNAWLGGAGNHDEATEGAWQNRLTGAVQAYFEWMPVREPVNQQGVYRNVRFGDLLDLNMLDTRLAGRDAQAETLEERNHSDRTLLGHPQEQWLSECLQAAQQQGVRWKVMGQQVMVAQLGTNDRPFNYDQWDGYPAARQRLFDSVRSANVENWVVLTGDIHSSWAMTLHDDPFADLPTPALGVELVTPGVTSPGITQYAQAKLAASSLEALLPHLEFVDFYYRGYVLLDITHERMQAEWWVVDQVDNYKYRSDCLRALQIPAGEATFIVAPEITPSKQQNLADIPSFSGEFTYLREWRRPENQGVDGMIAAQASR